MQIFLRLHCLSNLMCYTGSNCHTFRHPHRDSICTNTDMVYLSSDYGHLSMCQKTTGDQQWYCTYNNIFVFCDDIILILLNIIFLGKQWSSSQGRCISLPHFPCEETFQVWFFFFLSLTVKLVHVPGQQQWWPYIIFCV